MPSKLESADFADYTDYNHFELEIVKTAGFNSPWLATLKFIFERSIDLF
jgi:hypothetical protein